MCKGGQASAPAAKRYVRRKLINDNETAKNLQGGLIGPCIWSIVGTLKLPRTTLLRLNSKDYQQGEKQGSTAGINS
jgi:hypothetical protein